MRRVRLPLVVLMWPLLWAGCGTSEALDEGPTAQVEVRNRNWLSMEVVALASLERVRMGRLSPGQSKTFSLPSRLFRGGAREITFQMEAIGSEGTTLEERYIVSPGDTVVLVIPNTR